MLFVEQIKTDNSEKVKEIYEDFRSKALKNYGYEISSIEFEQFTLNIKENRLGGLVLFDDSVPQGLLIYSIEEHKVIEINVIHSIDEQNENAVRLRLLEELSEVLRDKTGWKAVSYPMLGTQKSFIRDIAFLNFKLVGQSIIKFDFKSPIAFRIFKKAQIPEIKDYKLSFWDEKYKEQAIEVIQLAFKNTKNTNFDPRFLSLEGTKGVLDMILTNKYGNFLSAYSRLLLRDDKVEGVCLTTMVAEDKLNIPIVAVRKDTRNKGMGKLLLKSVLSGFIKLIGDKKIMLSEINATTDTDNYPAVNMYRRLGFKEESFYAHSYLKNPNYKCKEISGLNNSCENKC